MSHPKQINRVADTGNILTIQGHVELIIHYLTKHFRHVTSKTFLYVTRDAPDIRPDNPAFFISNIRPDTGFDLPVIRPNTGY
jgi:hypothetical protein